MSELIRKIDKKDIPEIKKLLRDVLGVLEYKEIERLGGMTNRSYKITLYNGGEYLIRIPGVGTEELLSRKDEKKSTELGCRLGIDSELLYFGDDGKKVMRFIKNPQVMNEEVMKKKENIMQAAAIFRKLHNCGEDTGVRFEVFEMADSYEKIICENNVNLYADYHEVKEQVMSIKSEIDSKKEVQRVPCHNDSLLGNWVLDEDGRLYLIDWEYSGMNEAMWDLSCLSIEIGYNAQNDEDLLDAYYGRKTTVEEKKEFIAAKLYVDFLWTLWGLTRVPYDGQFMQKYADSRYVRLKDNIKTYRGLEE